MLFFVDESADSKFHFHIGLLATGEQINAAERDLDLVAQAALDLGFNNGRLPRPELHASAIFGGKEGGNVLPYERRFELVENALDVLAGQEIEVLIRGVEVARFRLRYGEDKESMHGIAFRNLLERLCERSTSRDELGLVIADEHGGKAILRANVREAKTGSTPGYRATNFGRILDTVHYVDSRDSRMVQLADLVAYTRRRRRSIPREDHPDAEAAMARIAARLIAAVPDPAGKYDTVYFA